MAPDILETNKVYNLIVPEIETISKVAYIGERDIVGGKSFYMVYKHQKFNEVNKISAIRIVEGRFFCDGETISIAQDDWEKILYTIDFTDKFVRERGSELITKLMELGVMPKIV